MLSWRKNEREQLMVEKKFEFRLSFLQVSNFDTTAGPTCPSQLISNHV